MPASLEIIASLQTTSITWAWVIFIAFVLLMLALDLGVFHRKSHAVGFREALGWSAFWITLGLLFSVLVYYSYDRHWFGLGLGLDAVDQLVNDGKLAATKYLTGYIVEKSLSVDNIFVMALIFSALAVPARYQHRVLFWGILGALVMRGVMIGAGAVLVHNFNWILYAFGAFLLFTGLKMLFSKDQEERPEESPVVRWIRKFVPVTRDFHGQHFFVRAGSKSSHVAAEPGVAQRPDPVVDAASPGKVLFTPLAVALIMVEITDLIFAVDSIPAVFAITADPFLVFTSNVFAILGLRSLYFALAGLIQKFRYLRPALSLILVLVGVKMLAVKWLKLWLGEAFNLTILGLVLAILAVGVIASVMAGDKNPEDITS